LAGERLDDVQPVGPVIGCALPPGAAHVFYLDPGGAGSQLAADMEGAAPGAGVDDFFPHSLCSVMFVLRLRCGFSFWLRRSCAGGCVVILVA